jgi:hypothetical protein
MWTKNLAVPGFLLSEHIDTRRKRYPRLAIKSLPCSISRQFAAHRVVVVHKFRVRCGVWDNPEIDEQDKVEIVRPYSKYYVDKQVYYYKGKYYRLSDIGLGEQWYALILDDNEPSDLTPERFKGLKTLQKIKQALRAVLSVVLGAVAWAGWNIFFASVSTVIIVVSAISFLVGVALFVILWTINQLENKFSGK